MTKYNFSALTKKLKALSFSVLEYTVDGVPEEKAREFLDDLASKITIDKDYLLDQLYNSKDEDESEEEEEIEEDEDFDLDEETDNDNEEDNDEEETEDAEEELDE